MELLIRAVIGRELHLVVLVIGWLVVLFWLDALPAWVFLAGYFAGAATSAWHRRIDDEPAHHSHQSQEDDPR